MDRSQSRYNAWSFFFFAKLYQRTIFPPKQLKDNPMLTKLVTMATVRRIKEYQI